MKSIQELRSGFDLNVEECASGVKYFSKQNIDWDVYLPSIGKNLQRGFVWSDKQRQELIYSIFLGRHIPHCAIIVGFHPTKNEDLWIIIDGKQRLSTILDFYNNKFQIELEGNKYFLNELPADYQQIYLNSFHFRYYRAIDFLDKPITDKQKINWFKFINFAGTAQDEEHLNSLIID